MCLSAFHFKQLRTQELDSNKSHNKLYITFPPLKEGEEPQNFSVESLGAGSFKVENLANGESKAIKVDNTTLKGNVLLRMDVDGEHKIVQHTTSKNDLDFSFYFKGAHRTIQVYD